MSLTKRAKKRLGLLLVIAVGVLLLGVVSRTIQQQWKDNRAKEARVAGLAAAESKDWNSALLNLSVVVTRDNNDLEALMALADARSRVPMPQARHLSSALTMFTEVCERAARMEGSTEILKTALARRGDLELQFGQVARLRSSSKWLLEIDPGNVDAIRRLVNAANRTDAMIPDNPELCVRGDRSNSEWLEALRSEGDESALRWLVEQLVIDPTSFSTMVEIVEFLNSGGSEERQRARFGMVRETPFGLVEKWIKDQPRVASDLTVLRASEFVRQGDPEEALRLLRSTDLGKCESPLALLTAASIYLGFDDPEVRQEAEEIFALTADRVNDSDPTMQSELAIRFWALGLTNDAIAVFRAAIEQGVSDPGLLTNAVLISAITGGPDTDEWRRKLEVAAERTELTVGQRERIAFVLDCIDISSNETMDKTDRIRELCGNFARWTVDPLVVTLLGDLAMESDLIPLSSKAYETGVAAIPSAVPIRIRLIQSLRASESWTRCLEEAAEFISVSRSPRALLELAASWVDLQMIGVDATEYAGVVSRFGTASGFIRNLRSQNIEDSSLRAFLDGLFIRALTYEGFADEATGFAEQRLAGNPDVTELGAVLEAVSQLGLALDAGIVAGLAAAEDQAAQDRLTLFRARQIDVTEGPAAQVEFLVREFEGREDRLCQRAIGFAMLKQASTSGGSPASALELLLSAGYRPADLPRLMRIATVGNLRSISKRIVEASRSDFGIDDPRTALIEGLFVLRFESGDPDGKDRDSIEMAIRRIDPIVAAGEASPELEVLYSRILRLGSMSNMEMIAGILQSSFDRKPEEFPTGLLLAEVLQDLGDFDEASAVLRTMFRRRSSATPAQIDRLSFLLGRQGRVSEMAQSICESAATSGTVRDLLRCALVRLSLGEVDEAEAIIEELILRPDRTVEVERAYVQMLIRSGDELAAIEYLEGSELFESEVARAIEVITTLLSTGRIVLANERMLEIPAEDAAASAEIQLLLAILTLQQDDGDVTDALDALDRAAELESESPGFLRRAATIAMSNPETFIESRRYIEKLGGIEPQQADLLLLRYDLEQLTEPLAADLLPRARELSLQSPKLSSVWSLYLDLLTRAFEEALASGRLADADLLADETKAAAASFVARFPGQPGPMRREAAVYLSLGDPETSLLKARAALDMVQGVPEVSDVILFARAAILAGEADRALDSLRKFKGEIIENPGRRPVARGLLFRSLLTSGETAEAYEVYSSMAFDQDDVQNWVDWIGLIEVIPVEAALKASRFVVEGRTDPSITLTVAAALGQSYRKNGDARLAAEAKKILAIGTTSGSDLETAPDLELAPLQIQIMRLEVLASLDEIDPITEALVIIRGLDDQYLDRVFSSEPGRNLEEDRLAVLRIPILTLLNNYVARSAEALLDGTIPLEALESVLGTGRRAADLLGRYAGASAEILDSRAMFMLAIGDLESARDLIDEAVDIRPDRAEFYYTQGVILLAMGDGPGATRSADRATGCLRYLLQPDPALEQKIRALKEQARNVEVSLQLDLRDSTSIRFTTVFGHDFIRTARGRKSFL